MNNLDYIKEKYKPYKYTIKGKCLIIETSDGKYVFKDNENNQNRIFNYLDARYFLNYPKVISDSRDNILLYEYIEDSYVPKEQKGIDLALLLANLHHKTTYFKSVTLDSYKEIYENIKSNLDYYEEYYNLRYNAYFTEIYHSPAHYNFLINYSLIETTIHKAQKELDDWFNMIKEKSAQRVVLNHNNASVDHLIKSDKDYLISWDNARIDTPVFDMVHFFKNNYNELDFSKVLDSYWHNYAWEDDEKKLFFILISIPPKIDFNKKNEFLNTEDVCEKVNYIAKVNRLIRPYDLTKKKE